MNLCSFPLAFTALLVTTGCAADCPEGFLRDNDGNCLQVDPTASDTGALNVEDEEEEEGDGLGAPEGFEHTGWAGIVQALVVEAGAVAEQPLQLLGLPLYQGQIAPAVAGDVEEARAAARARAAGGLQVAGGQAQPHSHAVTQEILAQQRKIPGDGADQGADLQAVAGAQVYPAQQAAEAEVLGGQAPEHAQVLGAVRERQLPQAAGSQALEVLQGLGGDARGSVPQDGPRQAADLGDLDAGLSSPEQQG